MHYEKYASVMDSWNIPRIREALNEEDTTWKILSIGQSHSADSIWLVQEVLQTERPNDKFFVAECLRSVTMGLYIAYLWYAQFYGLEKLDAVNVDVIEAHLRHWRWVSQGDVVLTPQMKEWIIEAVNYALENPTQMPQS